MADNKNKFLQDSDVQNLINQKIEDQIAESDKEVTVKIVKNFNRVPKDKVFSRDTTFQCFNMKTKKSCFINGTQADSIIATNESVRADLLAKNCDNFNISNYYVKFHCYKQEG